MEKQLFEQKHINEILARSVDRHSFAEKGIRSEFNRIKSENEALLLEVKSLKYAATHASSITITPPDSSSDKSTKGKILRTQNLLSSPNTDDGNRDLLGL